MNKGKAHGLYIFNLFVSWCAANSSLGSKVNSQLGCSKIQDQKKSLHQLGMDTGLLLTIGVGIELPGNWIKIKKDQNFQNPDEWSFSFNRDKQQPLASLCFQGNQITRETWGVCVPLNCIVRSSSFLSMAFETIQNMNSACVFLHAFGPGLCSALLRLKCLVRNKSTYAMLSPYL